MQSKLLPQRPSLIDAETLRVLRIGYISIYTSGLIEGYVNQGHTLEDSQSMAEQFFETPLGEETRENFIRASIEELQMKRIVAAFNRANPFWKQLAVGIIAAGLASFIGTMFVQILVAYFRTT